MKIGSFFGKSSRKNINFVKRPIFCQNGLDQTSLISPGANENPVL